MHVFLLAPKVVSWGEIRGGKGRPRANNKWEVEVGKKEGNSLSSITQLTVLLHGKESEDKQNDLTDYISQSGTKVFNGGERRYPKISKKSFQKEGRKSGAGRRSQLFQNATKKVGNDNFEIKT